jgi:hypothetical protein
MGSGQDAGGEQSRRRPIQGTASAPGDLMESAQGQAAGRQPAVDFWLPKSQNSPGNPASASIRRIFSLTASIWTGSVRMAGFNWRPYVTFPFRSFCHWELMGQKPSRCVLPG